MKTFMYAYDVRTNGVRLSSARNAPIRASKVSALSSATSPGGVSALLMNAATPPDPGIANPR